MSIIVARARDRHRLCSFVDASFQQTKGHNQSQMICSEQMNRVVDRCPNDVAGFRAYDYTRDTCYYVLCRPPTLVVAVAVNKTANCFSGATANQILSCACALLTDLEAEFSRAFSADVIMAATKPFQMISYETQVAKLLQRHTISAMTKANKPGGWASAPGAASVANASTAGANSYDTLKKELNEVQNVIRSNLEDILSRGERLDVLKDQSSDLRESSKKYYGKAVHMNRMRWIKTYGPPAVVAVMILSWFSWFYLL